MRTRKRARELAVLLREAHAGEWPLRHCALCGRLELGGEWLRLEAIGSGQYPITTSLIERATMGPVPSASGDPSPTAGPSELDAVQADTGR
jgi:hypothetical protein